MLTLAAVMPLTAMMTLAAMPALSLTLSVVLRSRGCRGLDDLECRGRKRRDTSAQNPLDVAQQAGFIGRHQ
jgi:hypothetical protein